MLFEVFRCEETDSIDGIAMGNFLKVSIKELLLLCYVIYVTKALESTGLRRSDPRLKEMVRNLERIQKAESKDDWQKLVINRKQFKE